MSPRSKQNLMSAMKCDAFQSATYSRFAAHARMDNDWELAKAFQDTADSDRTNHFAREARLDSLVSESPENLRNALTAEQEETLMFSQFMREAEEDGDVSVAAAFEKICHDKAEWGTRLEALLAKEGLHSNIRTVGQ